MLQVGYLRSLLLENSAPIPILFRASPSALGLRPTTDVDAVLDTGAAALRVDGIAAHRLLNSGIAESYGSSQDTDADKPFHNGYFPSRPNPRPSGNGQTNPELTLYRVAASCEPPGFYLVRLRRPFFRAISGNPSNGSDEPRADQCKGGWAASAGP